MKSVNTAKIRYLVLLLPAFGLVACAVAPPETTEVAPVSTELSAPEPEEPDETEVVLTLLTNFDRLAAQPADVQHQELQNALAGFEQNQNSESARLRLFLASSLPKMVGRDDAKLLPMPQFPIDAEPTLSWRTMALIHRLLSDRQRLVRDDMRRCELLKDEIRRHEASIREYRERVDELQQKLDALRAIDQDSLRQPRRRP